MAKMTKKEISNYHKRCLNLIRRKPPEFLLFKKLSICGWCLYDEDLLVFDYRKDFLRTAYHECLHYLYPEWSETKVIRAESVLINRLSLLEITTFLKHLAIKLHKLEVRNKKIETRKKNKTKRVARKKNK
jgi:hypothetical protein